MPKQFLSTLPKRFLTLGLAFLLSLIGVTLTGQSIQAQFSLPEGFGQTSGAQTPSGVTRYGSIEVTWVNSPLDNKRLFEIASPTVYDRSTGAVTEQIPVEQRADEIEAKLLRATSRILDQDTLSIDIETLNGATVIDAQDKNFTRPLVLMTVTDIDADYHGKPIDQLAEEWRDIVESEFDREFNEFLTQESLSNALVILLGLVALTVIVWILKFLISRQQKVLQQRKRSLNVVPQTEELVDPQQNVPAQTHDTSQAHEELLVQRRHQFLQGLKQTLNLDRRISIWGSLQWLLFWGTILAWCFGLYIITRSIPFLARWSGETLRIPLFLLAIWFLTGLAVRFTHRIIDRLSIDWQEKEIIEFIDLGDAQRRKLRISTIAGAAKGLITVLIVVVAMLSILDTLGVPAGSVLAIGGVFAFAISFGSQSLVKDIVNGFLILAEDQYAIGDVIDVGGAAGLVENLNLRVTQLRSGDGELVTIPNSAITEVKNLTRSWSRVNFSIDVAYQTDPDKALSVLRDVAHGMYDEPDWQDKILDPPDVLGIDGVSHSGMTITTWIKTAPLQQWAVGREFRLRVRKALEENGIDIGVPRQTYIAEAVQNSFSNGHQADTLTSDSDPIASQ